MRNPDDIRAEMASLGAPEARWSGRKAIAESLAAKKAWRQAHPDASARLDQLAAELGEAEEQAREMLRAARMAERLEGSGLGARTREAVEAASDSPAVVSTRQWLNAGRSWLLLAGDVGTGKTVAAGWALREVARQGQTVAFRRAAEVARLSGFDAGAQELHRLKRVGLLVLDDLGTECATGWGTSILHELLDTRHEAKLRTIITSNLKRADARARLGDRMADRVQQDGRVVWLEGASMRRST